MAVEPASASPMPALRARLAVAIGVGAAAAGIAYIKLRQNGPSAVASDFTTFWRAGWALLHGKDPYEFINLLGPAPFDGGFNYPLTAAVVTAPFALLEVRLAMVLFSGIGGGLLAFGLTRDGFARLPTLMSFPMLWCVSTGQWGPLITVAALLPGWAWLATVKPTLGLAAFAYRPTKRFAALALGFTAVTTLVWRWWPAAWLAEIAVRVPGNHRLPVLLPGGILMVLALARWRRPEARLLLAMACVPQAMLFYDQLPLLLVIATFRQALVAGLLSYVPYVAAYALLPDGPLVYDDVFPVTGALILVLYYLPALVLVLRRANEGDVPEPIERIAGRLPHWLRGRPASAASSP